MKRTIVPSVVVIQERHVRHGEKFQIVKVSSKKRRLYIAKFLSPRKITFRYKSRQVVIGQKLKQVKYKGSPIATSRLLLLDGLGDPFPSLFYAEKKEERRGTEQPETVNPPLSFFNLSDTRAATVSMGGSTKNESGLDSTQKSVIASAQMNSGTVLFDRQVEILSPQKFPDMYLLFGSDTTESDDFESDAEDDGAPCIEICDTVTPSPSLQKNDQEKLEKERQQKKMDEAIKRIETQVKQIAGNMNSFMGEKTQRVPRALVKHTQPSVSAGAIPKQPIMKHPQNRMEMQYLQNTLGLNNFGIMENNPHLFTDTNHIDRHVIQSSGQLPFFRVPGGCLMGVQAMEQATPTIYGTFITNNPNQMHYQQIELAISRPRQTIAIHLSPYRLNYNEIDSMINFINNSNVFTDPSNIGRF